MPRARRTMKPHKASYESSALIDEQEAANMVWAMLGIVVVCGLVYWLMEIVDKKKEKAN